MRAGALGRATWVIPALAAALATPSLGGASEPYATLDVDAVEKMLGAGDVRIYDANTRELFEKNHLPGAVHVGKQQLSALLPADRSTKLVFYCTGPK
jgi:rhodanese-related sulfurtransferase